MGQHAYSTPWRTRFHADGGQHSILKADTQTAADWVSAIMATLEFIGGVPSLLAPDQPRALMARPDRYEPTSHRLLEELS